MSNPLCLVPPGTALIINIMIYLITEQTIHNDGRVYFDPAFNTEVYDSYISALRYLVCERQTARLVGWQTEVIIPGYRDDLGRQQMITLVRRSDHLKVEFTISRINLNGYH